MRAKIRTYRDEFLSQSGSRPLVMGILNLTPDSFSDGGQFQATSTAIAYAKGLVTAGSDIVDVGAESTRPGATPISEPEEWRRLEPVLADLANVLGVPLSIDTYKAKVAAKAAKLGAAVVNDVWGLQKDPAMPDVVAEAETAVIIVHNRTEKDEAIDILSDIRRFFDRSLALAAKAGIPQQRIILDPGVGFGKTSRQNLEAVARLGELGDYGLPILIGASRKAFLGSLVDRGAEAALTGTVAVALAAAANGAAIFRVHDVAEHVSALKIFHMIRSGGRA